MNPSLIPIGVTEAELASKAVAPRITPKDLDHTIAHEYYHVPPGTTLTLCVLTLRNGFTVVGHAACAAHANFDADIGRRIAFEHARNQIWPLLGYELRSKLTAEQESAD